MKIHRVNVESKSSQVWVLLQEEHVTVDDCRKMTKELVDDAYREARGIYITQTEVNDVTQ